MHESAHARVTVGVRARVRGGTIPFISSWAVGINDLDVLCRKRKKNSMKERGHAQNEDDQIQMCPLPKQFCTFKNKDH